ncbi:MAG: FMN reductase [Candidatus Velthaea sp.]
MHVLGINGSLQPGVSRGAAALVVALEAAARAEGVTTEVLELRDYALEFCDGRAPDRYGADTRRALARIAAADAYVIATPVYRASYTGAFKNLFDLIPNDPNGDDPLRGKAIGLIATGGSDHHFLVLEHQLRPLCGFFGARTASRAVYGIPADFDEQRNPGPRLRELLFALAAEVVALARS